MGSLSLFIRETTGDNTQLDTGWVKVHKFKIGVIESYTDINFYPGNFSVSVTLILLH